MKSILNLKNHLKSRRNNRHIPQKKNEFASLAFPEGYSQFILLCLNKKNEYNI